MFSACLPPAIGARASHAAGFPPVAPSQLRGEPEWLRSDLAIAFNNGDGLAAVGRMNIGAGSSHGAFRRDEFRPESPGSIWMVLTFGAGADQAG